MTSLPNPEPDRYAPHDAVPDDDHLLDAEIVERDAREAVHDAVAAWQAAIRRLAQVAPPTDEAQS